METITGIVFGVFSILAGPDCILNNTQWSDMGPIIDTPDRKKCRKVI